MCFCWVGNFKTKKIQDEYAPVRQKLLSGKSMETKAGLD
jgi:hypothetical protein